jgi:dienelactone hydrolase
MTRRRNFSPWAAWSLHLQALADVDPFPDLGAAPDIVAWRSRALARVESSLGSMPIEIVPLDVEVTESVVCDDHVRHRVVFDTEATMSVPAYLLVPKTRTQPGSAVLAVHGHGPGKAMICGLTGPAHEHYALQFVRNGHVVLAPDLRCFGERQDPQWEPDGHKYDCDWNLVAATMAGINPIAQNLWDLQRCLDVLSTLDVVDPHRIAVAGFSYGATMSLFLAASDRRVRAAIVSGYLSSWRGAHSVPWNMCGSQVMFGQLGRIEHIDVAAQVAPRPILVESGRADPLFPIDAAIATVDRLRQVHRALGTDPDLVVHEVFAGEHRWNGAAALPFLDAVYRSTP